MITNKFTIQQSFAISAGAGSGKTYTLSRRFINILLGFDFFIENSKQEHFYADREQKNADLDQIVTITYTEAAALEMKERIFGLVNKILIFDTLDVDDEDYDSIKMAYVGLDETAGSYITTRLTKAQQEIAEANITTIHGFCLGILRRHSDVAKVDGLLDVLSDDDKNQIFNEVYFKVLDSDEYQEDILNITQYVSLFKSRTLIENYVFSHKFRESFDHYSAGKEESIKELLISTFLEPIEEVIQNAYDEIEGDPREEAFNIFVQSFYSVSAEKYTGFTEALGAPKTLGKKFPSTDTAKKQLEGLIGYFTEIDTSKEARFIEIIEQFRKLLKAIKKSYDEALLEVNGTDFDTIIQQAAKIIARVHTDFRYIMVDEFQDTNAIQWEIVKEASKNDANLFVVGDEKQSIYAFQGGEIEVFHNAIQEKFNGNPVQMGDNYRSDQKIIGFVNVIFESIFKESVMSNSQNKQIVNDFEARHQSLESKSDKQGSVSFLVTRIEKEVEEIESEAQNLALFIKSIVEGEQHSDLTQLIKDQKPAIAVLHDAKSKMLGLKEELMKLGVECKVSASENYYHATEITDIFFVLKALSILKNKENMEEITASKKFYIAGAMKSSILHFTDKEVYDSIKAKEIPSWFIPWLDKASKMPIHTLVKALLSESDAYAAYALMDNYEQRLANIDKFLTELITFEQTHGYDLSRLVRQLEQNIYFSDAEEDEAFYRSSTGGSIELCSIHSTKGLAYPMVILADSAKRLTSQVTSESIKFNKLKDSDDELYNLIGFKVEEYEPISLRLLKEIDKRKHMAEKKRLYYVALTRPKNHLVISANLKATNSGVGSISDSYLEMTLDALNLTKEQLFDMEDLPNGYDFIYQDDLTAYAEEEISKEFTIVEPLKPIQFEKQESKSATAQKSTEVYERDDALERAALRGTLVHKALELFWNDLDNEIRFIQLFIKENITDEMLQNEIKTLSRNFKDTDVYAQLKAGAETIFEFGFEEIIDGEVHRGSVDLLMKDYGSDGWVIVDFKSGKEREAPEYEEQLEFYKKVLEYKGLNVIESKLCWLG